MTIGMQREKSAAATAMRMSDVACGYIWQVAFTADKLSLLSLGGAVLVTVSILIIVVYKENSPGSSTTNTMGSAPGGSNSNSNGMSSSGEGGALEMTQFSTLHHSLSLEELYDLEEGFQDSDVEGDASHTAVGSNGSRHGSKMRGAEKFDFAALRARLEADGDIDWAGEGGESIDSSKTATTSVGGSGGDLDLSLHGEHGGLLNAQLRSAAEKKYGYGRGAGAVLPLFGAGDAGI